MNKVLQLDFFEETEITQMKSEIESMSESLNRIRKGLYAKNGSLEKKYQELDERLGIIERNICKINT